MHARPFPPSLHTLAPCLLALGALAGELTVNSVEPGINAGNAAFDQQVLIHFDRPLAPSSLPPASADMAVYGRATGPAAGVWSLENGGSTARFVPDSPFSAGEVVRVTLSSGLTALDGTTLRSAGFVFEFGVRSRPNTLDFEHLETINVRTTPGQSTRVYGGTACDLDDDGFVDMAIINQDTSDVRVLLNRADGSGRYDPVLFPVNSTGSTPSPNEAADLDGDGLVDLVAANKFGDSVSVLMGNGDGTFAARVDYPVGDLPRGLALLDMDGDGDIDIATANANSSDLSLLFNAGDGTFGPTTFIQGGGSSEWGLAAGDMNNDGILDLVVGARGSQRLIVHLGDGDGTFTQAGSVNGVGGVWMVVLGDLDGDGNLDVSTANGTSNSGAIVLGDGAGNLALQQIMPAPSFVVATDLGDLDGDGDLDWILSSFTGGRWTLYENDGAANFTLARQFVASANAACALMLDFDNDLDLDLALLDEIADEVVLWENVCPTSTFCAPTANSTGAPALASMTGSCAVAENDLTVHAAPVPENFGLLFFGQTPTAGAPVGNGVLCLGSPAYRGPVSLASGQVLSLRIDLENPPGPAAMILPGSTWYFQAVFRDAPAGGAMFNFAQGIEILFL